MLEAVRLMQEEDLTIEEVDALTGTAIGWPRTGTFRLADLVGIDVLAHVAANFASRSRAVACRRSSQTMLERRWLGDKTKQGFYKKEKDADGQGSPPGARLEDPRIRAGDPAQAAVARNGEECRALPERLAQLLAGDVRKDKAARFHWRLLSALWNYAADCLPEIADDAASVDRAMRAGFNWEMGPFELWDAAGVPRTVARMRAAGEPVSANVERLLAAGADAWYRDHGRECFDVDSGTYQPMAEAEGIARVADFRASNGVVQQNPGASLVDLGDGVACLELHSKKNAIGEDIVRLVTETLRPEQRRRAQLRGLRHQRRRRATSPSAPT